MNFSRVTSTIATVLPVLLVMFFLYLMTGVAHIETDQSNVDGKAISTCIEKYKPLVYDQANPQNASITQFLGVHTFCYSTILSQLKIDQEKILRDNYLFQRNENVVLLYMVVLITLSGVALAGLQLLASYELAKVGRGELAGGGEINYSAQQGVSFKSSVVGLMILALSFAFFLVFILYVYSFQDSSSKTNVTNASKTEGQTPPAQPRLNLLPANPAQKDGKDAVEKSTPNAQPKSGPQ
jgi:hypothetical protein